MTASSKAIAACATLILLCIGALSYWSEVRNDRDREWVTHTFHVVEKLQALRIDITQCETGQRGYMLTGQDRYQDLYRVGVNQVRQDMKELPDLTKDNPSEQRAIEELNPLIAARLAELDDGILVRKQGGLLAGVEAVTRANNGEKRMGQIAAQIGEMRDNEAALLRRRLETAAASTRTIKIIIAVGNSLAILILVVKFLVIQREIARRNLAEASLKLANKRLERQTAELSETNTELQSFAYSVAHDLRAPLRHISAFSAVIQEDYGARLDAEGIRLLGKIAEGAQKMGRLVDDLLGLSKIGRQELSLQDTSLDSLLRQAIEEVAPEWAGRKLEWQIGELRSAQCDPGLMKQVFVNLLSNSVKYTRTRERAVIQVGQIMQNEEPVIVIRDNGVGFDMQYADKLFGVFQRLHKARDFEGTGVGLATVQRIIHKHGGRIWVEAELDRGAAFFFTLGPARSGLHKQSDLPIHQEEMHVARS
jgi:signal transduction histidine kinase